MADTNDLLKAIESIKKDMATKRDIQRVEQVQKEQGTTTARLEQGQAQTNTSLGQITTAVEAIAAGQKDLATKTDIHRLEQKIDKVAKDVKSHRDRIENL
jgi:septal ring factor EnvC (AmiA/AmiB activator)